MMQNFVKNHVFRYLSKNSDAQEFHALAQSFFSAPNLSFSKPHCMNQAKLVMQGFLNGQIIPYHASHIWPYWVYNQTDPQGSGWHTLGLPYLFLNTSNRNWTRLSYPGNDDQALIDPRGLITPFPGGWSVDIWVSKGNFVISPSQLKQVKQSFDQKTHGVHTIFTINGLEIDSEVFFKPSDLNETLIHCKVKLKNTSLDPHSFSIYVAIRPYNPEGLTQVKDITYLSSQMFMINHEPGLLLDKKPDNIACLAYKDRRLSEYHKGWEMILQTKCADNLASAYAEYRLQLSANQEDSIMFKIPAKKNSGFKYPLLKELNPSRKSALIKRIHWIQSRNFTTEKLNTISERNQLFQSLMSLSLPDNKMDEAYKLCVIHLHNSIGSQGIKHSCTNAQYSARSWISIITALIQAAGKSQDFNPLSSLKSGYSSETLAITIIGLYHAYQFTQNRTFLEQAYPYIRMLKQQIQSKKTKGKSQNSWLPILWQNPDSGTRLHDYYTQTLFWIKAGLFTSQIIAGLLNKTKDHEHLHTMNKHLSDSLERYLMQFSSFYKTQPYLPVSETRLNDPGLITTLDTVYPLNLLSAYDERITNTLALLEAHYLQNGLLFSHVDPPGYGTAQNARLAQVYLARQDIKAFEIMQWLISQLSETGCWPDSIHPVTKGGHSGDGHSVTAAAEFILLVRNMLIGGDDKNLHIFPFIPPEWLTEGRKLEIKNCPTIFGTINITASFHENKVKMTLNPDFHRRPASLKISLPKPISAMNLDGLSKSVGNNTVHVPPLSKTIEFSLISV
ncbi:hypothetical protein ACFL96_01485 [Thermoproteota archaeon]